MCREQGTIHLKCLSSLDIRVGEWSNLSKFAIETAEPLVVCLESYSWCDIAQIYRNIAIFTKDMKKNLKSSSIKEEHNDQELSADYVIKLISSFERLDSFQIEYDWYSQEATNAIIHLLTNCQKIKNLKCTVPLDYTRTPAGREKTQRRFIDSFNGHAKVVQFNAADWDINFEFEGNGIVSNSKRS